LDVFGYSAERRTERALIGEYERVVEELLQSLDSARLPLAAEIASIPEFIRGYGHVKGPPPQGRQGPRGRAGRRLAQSRQGDQTAPTSPSK
jgi:hypothetical protein